MKYDPDRHHRRSIRLKGYDYSQAGAYFVTICTQNRELLLGEIVNGTMRVNPFGEIANACWDDLPRHYPYVKLDTFVVMPNHVHAIIGLADDAIAGADFNPAPAGTRHGLAEIVRAFKTFSARRINILRNTLGTPVWQRNYYEHVVRDETDLNNIRQYVINNPVKWEEDKNNPRNLSEAQIRK